VTTEQDFLGTQREVATKSLSTKGRTERAKRGRSTDIHSWFLSFFNFMFCIFFLYLFQFLSCKYLVLELEDLEKAWLDRRGLVSVWSHLCKVLLASCFLEMLK